MTSPAIRPPNDFDVDIRVPGLAQAPRMGVEFLISLNHAIRTPMSGILGLSELMLENPTDAENREYLLSIRCCAAALNDLLSATLDYASHLAGAVRLEQQDFPLHTALEAGLRDAAQRADDNGTVFEPEASSDLSVIVRSDALRLRDLTSLIARVAIHSSSNGRVRFQATVAHRGPHSGELTMRAWREGKPPSCPESHSAQSLEPASHPSAELQEGAFRIETLEAALVHHLVELLRGSARITSEPHAPVAVQVVLPLALRDAALQVEESGLSNGRRSILIADDNLISLRILSSILGRAGFDSVAVSNGPAAIEALARRDFDLVLLDLAMPGMDGDVTTARIRNLPNCGRLPVVGITAGVTEELRESCRRNGMDAILGKPIDAGALVASVNFQIHRAAANKRGNQFNPE